MVDRTEHSPLQRYWVSIASAILATALSLALAPSFGGRSPLAPFVVAVLVSAWYGGLWPGLSATFSSIVIARFLLVRAVFEFVPIQSGWPLLISFALLGIAISIVAEKLLRTNVELRRAKNLLEEANQKLNLELVEHRNTELQYKLISENATDVTWLWNLRKGRLGYVSPSVKKLTGFSPEEVMGQSMRKTMPREARKMITNHIQRRASAVESGDDTARIETSEIELLRKDGTTVFTETLTTLLTNERGLVTQVLGITRDITERKLAEEERIKLEEHLRQAQKLEGIGRLAGGVAHEFNNLLTIINGYSYCLLDRLNPSDPSHEFAEAINESGERAAILTKQLLAFSRKQLIRPQSVDLNSIVRSFADMLQRLIGEHISLVTRLDGSCGAVLVDPDQLHQVLMNLVLNARDAMPDGGRLEISTANTEVDEIDLDALDPEVTPAQYVSLIVTDNGHGMDEMTRQRAFEPFFTTKQVGEGTGLGLATVYGIIRQSGGWITVQSEVGTGSTFTIYLRRIDGPPLAEVKAGSSKAKGGDETILVVEDERGVLALTEAVLVAYGYHVIAAETGEDAVASAEHHPGHIHLLLTDVLLPGISGRTVSERLKALRPNLKVLYTSGYTADLLVQRGALDRGVALLNKPFSPDELAAKVRETLDFPNLLEHC